MFWLWYLLIGAIAGWIAGVIVKGSGSGLLMNIVIGIVGGFLGGGLFKLLGLGTDGKIGSLITAVIGAIVLLLVVGWFKKKQDKVSK